MSETYSNSLSKPCEAPDDIRTATCILCDTRHHRVLFKARDRLYNIQREFCIIECVICGLKSTVPKYSEEEIISLYPSEYSPHQLCDLKQINERSTEGFIKKFVKPYLTSLLSRLLDTKSHILPPLSGDARILELGCAAGSFLRSLKGKGWHLYGVEPVKTPARHAREVSEAEVFCGTIKEAKYPSNFFDAVFAWMTVEHLVDPLETLNEVYRVLNKNAYFVFSIPNAGSWEWSVFKNRWYGLQVPFHFYHFTPKTISMLLDKTGFRIEMIEHQRNCSNIVASLGYAVEDAFGKNKIAQWLTSYPDRLNLFSQIVLAPLAILMAKLHQGGRMTIVARISKHK